MTVLVEAKESNVMRICKIAVCKENSGSDQRYG